MCEKMKIEKTTGKTISKNAGDSITIRTNANNILEFIHIFNGEYRIGMITIDSINDSDKETIVRYKEE